MAAAACAAPAMASQMTAITQMNANGRRGAPPSRATRVRGSAPGAVWARAGPVGRSAVRSRSSPQVLAEYAPSVRSWNSSRSIRPATYASRSSPAASSRSRSEARIASSLVISVFPSSPPRHVGHRGGPVDIGASAADAASRFLPPDQCGYRRRALSSVSAGSAAVSSCEKGDKPCSPPPRQLTRPGRALPTARPSAMTKPACRWQGLAEARDVQRIRRKRGATCHPSRRSPRGGL